MSAVLASGRCAFNGEFAWRGIRAGLCRRSEISYTRNELQDNLIRRQAIIIVSLISFGAINSCCTVKYCLHQ